MYQLLPLPLPKPAFTDEGTFYDGDGQSLALLNVYFTADQVKDYARACMEVRARPAGWQPIATAPRDGSAFITFIPGEDTEHCFDISGWNEEYESFWKYGCGFEFVTHWMPLPEPPAAQQHSQAALAAMAKE